MMMALAAEDVNFGFAFNFKKKQLLSHSLSLQRQKLLLFNSRVQNNKMAREQEDKLSGLSLFLSNLALQFISYTDIIKEDSLSALLDGVEMLRRALKFISSSSSLPSESHRLLLKQLLILKLRILVKFQVINQHLLDETFNFITTTTNVFITKSSSNFEVFYEIQGIHKCVDERICTSVINLKSLTERIDVVLRFASSSSLSDFVTDLVRNLFESIRKESLLLTVDQMRNLLDVIKLTMSKERSSCNSNSVIMEFCMIIYLSNRFEFLKEEDIFTDYLNILLSLSSSASGSSGMETIVTSFNSRIRSFLSNTNTRKEQNITGSIVMNCIKFIKTFSHLNLSCLKQFSEAIVNFQIFSHNLIFQQLNPEDRSQFYELFRESLMGSSSGFDCKAVKELFSKIRTNDEIKFEFILFFIRKSGHISNSQLLLQEISKDLMNSKYFEILKLLLLPQFIRYDRYGCHDRHDTKRTTANEDKKLELKLSDKIIVLKYLKDSVLPTYVREFRSLYYPIDEFIEITGLLTAVLLEYGLMTLADLTGVFGLSVANSAQKSDVRACYCKFYSIWMSLDLGKNGQMMRNVLNPKNSPEFWFKIILDFDDYGQVNLFKMYYKNQLQTADCISSRIVCFRLLELPTKFTVDILMKSLDFSQLKCRPDQQFYWKFLLELFQEVLPSDTTGNAGQFRNLLIAYFYKNVPWNDLNLIFQLHQIIWTRNVNLNELDNIINNNSLTSTSTYYSSRKTYNSPIIYYLKHEKNSTFKFVQKLKEEQEQIGGFTFEFIFQLFCELLSCNPPQTTNSNTNSNEEKDFDVLIILILLAYNLSSNHNHSHVVKRLILQLIFTNLKDLITRNRSENTHNNNHRSSNSCNYKILYKHLKILAILNSKSAYNDDMKAVMKKLLSLFLREDIIEKLFKCENVFESQDFDLEQNHFDFDFDFDDHLESESMEVEEELCLDNMDVVDVTNLTTDTLLKATIFIDTIPSNVALVKEPQPLECFIELLALISGFCDQKELSNVTNLMKKRFENCEYLKIKFSI